MRRPQRMPPRGASPVTARAATWRETSPLLFVSFLLLGLVTAALLLAGCGVSAETADELATAAGEGASDEGSAEKAALADENRAEAIFAGGCFWCMEPPFDKTEGVHATISGYIGGHKDDPTYKEVSRGGTGHTEAVKVVYDRTQVTYEELLDIFWHNIDPTVEDRQFCDWGSQYRTGVFYLDEEQQELAEASKQEIVDSGRFDRVVTEITEATTFYPAEEYHQDFYKKKPGHYQRYRQGCGRDARLAELWGEAG